MEEPRRQITSHPTSCFLAIPGDRQGEDQAGQTSGPGPAPLGWGAEQREGPLRTLGGRAEPEVVVVGGVLLPVLLGGEDLASRPSHSSPARWNQFPLTTGSSWGMNGVTDTRF